MHVQVRKLATMCNRQIERAHTQLLHELRQLSVFDAVEAACEALIAVAPQRSGVDVDLPRDAANIARSAVSSDDGSTDTPNAPEVPHGDASAVVGPLRGSAADKDTRCKAEQAARHALQHAPSPPTRLGARLSVPSATAAPLGRAALHGSAVPTTIRGGDPPSGRCTTCGRALSGEESHADAECARRVAADALARAPEATQRIMPEICTVYLILCRQVIQQAADELLAASSVAPGAQRVLRALPQLLHVGDASRGSSLVEDEVAILEQQLGKLVVLDGEAERGSSADSHEFMCLKC